MSTQQNEGSSLKGYLAPIVIVLSIAVAAAIYFFILGYSGNFEGGTTEGHPLNYMGTVYKGGVIVPLLISILIIIVTFSIERSITLSKATGKGRVEPFVRNVRALLAEGKVDQAIAKCDEQRGSLANVVKAGLTKYKNVQTDTALEKESKVVAIQKEIEEATALELPMLSKNLVIISTLASIATLVGLIGTVFGMIKAFQALSQAGAPDATALATGISEALINTALGIIGSAIAIIMYNYFSSKIDSLTYSIDEAGFTIVQSYASKN